MLKHITVSTVNKLIKMSNPTLEQLMRNLVQVKRMQLLGPITEEEKKVDPAMYPKLELELQKQCRLIESGYSKVANDIMSKAGERVRVESEEYLQRIEGILVSAAVDATRQVNEERTTQRVAELRKKIMELQAEEQELLKGLN